jgi:hypothetical protein
MNNLIFNQKLPQKWKCCVALLAAMCFIVNLWNLIFNVIPICFTNWMKFGGIHSKFVNSNDGQIDQKRK